MAAKRSIVVAVTTVWALVIAGAIGVGIYALTRGDDKPEKKADEKTTSQGTESDTADGGEVTLDDLYDQTISWSSCGSNECGTLEVPINYQDLSEGTIEIALEKAAATGDSIGALVVNPGGPGAPGTDMATQASDYFPATLLESFDIVGFDPRGTGDSAPIDCLTDDQVDTWLATDPDPDNQAEIDQSTDESATYWAGCEAKSGKVAAHTSTVEAARDMDLLRAALGEDKLDYLGFSYGTRLGATYAELYPDKTGRLVLDGAVDPSISSRDGSLSQAKGFETALRSYVKNCVDGGNCFLGDTVDAGVKTIKGVIDSTDQKPLPTSDPDGREVTEGLAFYGLILPLYSEGNWPALDQALKEALDKHTGNMLLYLADIYASRENGKFTDNSIEAIGVINCLDDPWSITADKVPSNFKEFEKASPTFGKVFAWGLTGCNGIPFTATDEPDLKIDGSGAAPIVVLGTTRDPATPYEEAVAMADQLESGVLVSRDGDGHTAYNRGNQCIDDAVEGYLIDGKVPKDGLKC